MTNRLLKQGSAYTFFTFVSAAVPFLLLPLLTNKLDPSEYGEISLFTAVLGILSSIIGVNSHSFASRSFYDTSIDDNKVLVVSLVGLLFSGILVLAILTLFSSFLPYYSGLKWFYISLAYVTSIFSFVNEFRLSRYQVKNRIKSYGLLQIGLATLGILFTYMFVNTHWLCYNSRIIAISVSIIFIGIFSIISLSAEYRGEFKFDKSLFKEMLHFGLPIFVHLFSTVFVTAYDRFLINSHLSLSDLGVYSVAFQFSLILSIFYSAVNKAIMPWMFERLSKDDEDSNEEVSRLITRGIIFVSFLMLISMVALPELLRLFVNESYYGAISFLMILLVGQSFQGIYLLFINQYFFYKKTRTLSFISLFVGAFNVVLMSILIIEWGLAGVAWSFTLSMMLRAGLVYQFQRKF